MVEIYNTENGSDDGPSKEYVKPELNATEPAAQSESYYDYKKNRRKQQLAVAVLGVVGAGFLILGFIQIKNIIEVPWPVSKNEKSQAIVKTDSKKETVDLKSEDPKKLKQQ